jgi:hypothetical protein
MDCVHWYGLMAADLRRTFGTFQEQSNKEQALIVVIMSISQKALQDISAECTKLLQMNSLLTQLHYIAHASRPFSCSLYAMSKSCQLRNNSVVRDF